MEPDTLAEHKLQMMMRYLLVTHDGMRLMGWGSVYDKGGTHTHVLGMRLMGLGSVHDRGGTHTHVLGMRLMGWGSVDDKGGTHTHVLL